MTRLPSLSGRKIIEALSKAGFFIERQRGSHIYLRHNDGRATVVPIPRGEDLGRGLVSKILRDVDLSREEFIRLL